MPSIAAVAHLALAGATCRAYELLAGLLMTGRSQLWYGDRRCVDPEDPRSNHSAGRRLPARPVPLQWGWVQRTDRRVRQTGRQGRWTTAVLGELGPEAALGLRRAAARRVPPAAADGLPHWTWPAGPGRGRTHRLAVPRSTPGARGRGVLPARARRSKPRPAGHAQPAGAARRPPLPAAGHRGRQGRPIAAVLAGPDPHIPASLLASRKAAARDRRCSRPALATGPIAGRVVIFGHILRVRARLEAGHSQEWDTS